MAFGIRAATSRLRARLIDRATPFRLALDALLEAQGTLNILQVGANDGRIGDPLYGFVLANPDKTQIILVEPQLDLIDVLQANYAFHPKVAVFQGAVGQAGLLWLHKVRQACWPDLAVPYAIGWPAYRAPTGVTSARRDMVLDWLSGVYRGTEAIETLVDTISVESCPTSRIMARTGLFERLDVLQIDAEGSDDQVIAASEIFRLRPRLINFEAIHLGTARYAVLEADLVRLGYEVRNFGKDALARRLD
jgi:Methyltransferase FkbM domain